MLWLWLTFGYVVVDAFATISQKILMKSNKSDPKAYMIVFQILTAILMLVFFLLKRIPAPSLQPVLINIIISATLVSGASLFTFKGLQLIDASEFTILGTVSTFCTIIASAVFLGEQITFLKIVGSILVMLGVVAVAWKKNGKWKFTKGHAYALMAAILFGLAFANDAAAVRKVDVIYYLFVGFLMPGLVVLVANPKSISQMKSLLEPKMLTKMLAFCALYGLAAILIFSAYSVGGDASVVYPISKVSIIGTVMLGVLLLKEHENIKGKLLGVLLAFAGVLFLK